MLSCLTDDNALAIIFNSESIENEYIIYTIRNELLHAGIEPWQSIEADIYTIGNSSLIIARPSPPLCRKGLNIRVRR